MKIILQMELNEEDLRDVTKEEMTEERVKAELKQLLFEICEAWVFKGEEPNLDFVK